MLIRWQPSPTISGGDVEVEKLTPSNQFKQIKEPGHEVYYLYHEDEIEIKTNNALWTVGSKRFSANPLINCTYARSNIICFF